ncbi:MAG: translation initiation factor IF-2 [Candidatus Sungbacteria bacterium]|nr:translation initiation factor IF-2 [Candidatus Sungbacteria bacterium]
MKDAVLQQEKIIRPPIIVVMGHIDHGKTTILDWYRKSKIAEGETGGITQHIGAYSVEHDGKTITFIDTPGHEAFSKMRSRGAKVADIAILVIAADEGIKPQTKEAIKIIQEHQLPFIVALNKIDRPEANPERVKQELAKEGILVEGYGGSVPAVEISAKTGLHMDDMLETLSLLAELEELNADLRAPAEGVVVESHLDSKRGITSTFLIQNGTLAKKNILVIGKNIETIKIFEDFRGKPIESAGPSAPVRVIGLIETPIVGDNFHAFANKSAAEAFIASLPEDTKSRAANSIAGEGVIVFNIVLKADVSGSEEVLQESLKKFESEKLKINILSSGIGNINETDVKLAMATKLVTVVGFRVKTDASARELARIGNIHIISGDIIYELLDRVKTDLVALLPSIVRRVDLGVAKILKIFKQETNDQIVGGRIEQGILKRGCFAEIKRNKIVIGKGTVKELQQNKNTVDQVEKGLEFGAMFASKTPLEPGDVLDLYQEEVIKQTL